MSDNIKKMIGQVFNDIADGLETGSFGKKVRVGLTSFGSEHGTENLVKAAELAQSRDSSIEVVLIGPKAETNLTQYEVSDEEAGTVIGQSLDEGYKQDPTDKSRSITLTVSKGSYVILENYVGMKYEEAESKLKALGFNVTKREQSSDEDSGTVIDQNLASGYKVDPSEKNRNITLTVSTGYSQTVPSVIGLSPDSAKTNLTNLGFVVSMVGEQFPEDGSGDERYIGAVYKQSIDAGTKVTKKQTEITIYYYED